MTEAVGAATAATAAGSAEAAGAARTATAADAVGAAEAAGSMGAATAAGSMGAATAVGAAGAPFGSDPRPAVTSAGLLEGGLCVACEMPLLYCPPLCPECGAQVRPASFGPDGTVWSSTVLRIRVSGRLPPAALAYVDIDGGPRLLAHLPDGSSEALPPGARVRLIGRNDHGDPLVSEASKQRDLQQAADRRS